MRATALSGGGLTVASPFASTGPLLGGVVLPHLPCAISAAISMDFPIRLVDSLAWQTAADCRCESENSKLGPS